MAFDLLDTPLRMTWDLHGPDGPMPPDIALRVADELVAAGVFFVTLDRRPLLHPALGDILQVLAGGALRTLVVAGGEEEIASLSSGLPIETLLLDAQGYLDLVPDGFASLEGALGSLRAKGYEPSLFLTPRRDNLQYLPGLLNFCREKGIGRIKLPNTPVDDSFLTSSAKFLPRPEDLDRLRSLVGDDPAALYGGLALEVHDLFLWEIFFPDRKEGRTEYGGCQGANSLGHIDARGNVHPCSSWPQPLGSLLKDSLPEIWESEERRRVRDGIATVPSGCVGCRDYFLCLGGCRGLVRCLKCEGGRDPLCRGRRE